MKIQLPRITEMVSSREIFRIASLFLYLTLLLHVVLTTYARQVALKDGSIVAVVVLILLFSLSLTRYVWVNEAQWNLRRILFELFAAIVVVSLLKLERTVPVLPLPWLVWVAGVFPLALTTGVALATIGFIALIGLAINFGLGTHVGEWLPSIFGTLFVGLLAIFLSKALSVNVSAIRQARTNERRFDAIARATRHVFIIADAQFDVKFINPASQEVFGYSPAEIERDNIRPVVHPDDAAQHQKKLHSLRDNPKSRIFSRYRTLHKDGHWIWLETRGYNMLHDAAINGLVFSIEDISARKDAERKLEEEHALLRAVLDLNPSMIYAKDNDGHFTISNLSFQHRFGYSSEEEIRGKTSYDISLNQEKDGSSNEICQLLHMQDMQVIKTGMPMEDLEIQGFWNSESRSWYRTNRFPLRDANGLITGVLGIAWDITDRKEYEMRLQHLALHDPLTGLPNRRYLLDTIADRMIETDQKPARLAMLFCDLDFFKSVNDTHGHDFGDKCLLEITRRIVAALPPDDFVARFGGDEFVVLAETNLLEASIKAAALLQALSTPLVLDDVVVKIQVSIGIALLGLDHKSPSELIRDADAAMYQAKERGRNRVQIFDASLQNSTTKYAQMDVALRFALERNELTLVYQPKVSMIDGSVKGFELLLRWNSPQYGHISPNEFIPIAETSGMVVPIGLWALEQACEQLSIWKAKYYGIENLTIAVNVSMRQLLQSSFLDDVTGILERTGTAPQSIELELTETSVMANPMQTIENLTLLKKLGLRLALDDFGTGYSSLAYLQKLPIDVLKIDKAFVHGLGKNQGDAEIVRLILALAKTLNLETIAEGVESREHMIELKKLGCYIGQGYVFSPPITADEAEMLLSSPRQFLVA